ncbi:AAA family ATPase [Clostridium algoriphilum]|uniref:AAA family ATPase n=1 Tax=Clostridium algoriphilum TaxID=198347 RepID=UPI00299DF5B7|nr:AAA family ATPase [Clostridium algoriphilum]
MPEHKVLHLKTIPLVAIASVLSINPEVLILDEPTNGLDPRTQRWLINLIVELNNAGKTLIMCTHNLDIIFQIYLLCRCFFYLSL